MRHGVEQKSLLARANQAKLYLERAQVALDVVKVVYMMPLTSPRH
jgi:hypothetical protein